MPFSCTRLRLLLALRVAIKGVSQAKTHSHQTFPAASLASCDYVSKNFNSFTLFLALLFLAPLKKLRNYLKE